jgi:DNA-binding MarR family transcriptional regulator
MAVERAPDAGRDRDPDLVAILEFTEFVGHSARSPRQRERIARAARVPVTGAELVALRIVARHGPVAAGDVARRLGVDQSTASRQVRALEARGLVKRAPDRDDRRVAWLTATPKGRSVIARVDDVILNDFDVATGDWSAGERAQLAKLLDRFRTALRSTHTDEQGWSVGKDEPERSTR